MNKDILINHAIIVSAQSDFGVCFLIWKANQSVIEKGIGIDLLMLQVINEFTN